VQNGDYHAYWVKSKHKMRGEANFLDSDEVALTERRVPMLGAGWRVP
jgi:hypothetical protein